MISDKNADVSLDKSKGLIWEKHCCCRRTGRNFGAERASRSCEAMGCFVAQTMDSSVGQIEELICSKPFGENLLAF